MSLPLFKANKFSIVRILDYHRARRKIWTKRLQLNL